MTAHANSLLTSTVTVNGTITGGTPAPRLPDDFAQARELQWLWKTAAMQRMALAIVQLAVEEDPSRLTPHASVPGEFAADDLPEDLEHGGSGIAGSVFAVLVNNGIIRRAGIRQGGEFYGKERVSKRPGRKDAKLKVFTLADAGKARAFLRAKHAVKELRQGELLACS